MSPFAVALALCQLALAVILLTAAISKILSTQDYLTALRLSRVPKVALLPLASLVIVLELTVSVLLLQGNKTLLLAGFAICTATLSLFAIWAVWMYERGMKIRCGCFGDSATTIGPTLIFRNLALVLLAVFGLTLASRVGSPLPQPSGEDLIAVSSLGTVYALAIAFLRARRVLVYSVGQLLETTAETDEGSVA